MDYLSELNPAQREAVEYNQGPELVIAGAGSGKTRVLTYKVAYLLEQGVPASQILALTFTNKAAREMKQRICKLVGEETARYLNMGTFHSICARILRQEAEALGYSRDYSIYDTTDSKSVIKHVIQDMQLDEKVYKISLVLNRISKAKNQLLAPNDYAANRDYLMQDRFEHVPEVARIYTEYNRRLKAANAMDFDDLLFLTYKLFHKNPDVLAKYQEHFTHILVDEYQDTNRCQYLIVKALAEPQNKVCVVGDDAQSIYSFRGANIENILNFTKGYEHAALFKLEQNYRSTQMIVNAANSLIHRNKGQIKKEVFSERNMGERLQLSSYLTDRDEGKAIAKLIPYCLQSDRPAAGQAPMNYDDIAVLYRTNAQSRVIEDELRAKNIPYRIYGGTSFYQRKEIKDALGYFRLAVNTKDNEALLRIINYPTRGIGDTTVQKLREAARLDGEALFEVVAHPQDHQVDLPAGTLEKLQHFTDMIGSFAAKAETEDAYTLAEEILRVSTMMQDAIADTTPEGVARKENLDEMLSGMHEFVENRMNQGIDSSLMADFLSEVSLLTDQDENLSDTAPRVTLMTVHAAKGLEFRVVMIVGLEENLFPSQFSTSPKEIEEERRLLYVAITRAMDRCFLLHANQRFRNGQTTFSMPSRFIREIDQAYVCRVDGQELTSRRATSSFLDETRKTRVPAAAQQVVAQNLKRTTGIQEKSERQAFRSPFKKDDRVLHKVFGAGTVTDVYRENDNDKIDITFDQVGRKTLLLTYAKLEKIVD